MPFIIIARTIIAIIEEIIIVGIIISHLSQSGDGSLIDLNIQNLMLNIINNKSMTTNLTVPNKQLIIARTFPATALPL